MRKERELEALEDKITETTGIFASESHSSSLTVEAASEDDVRFEGKSPKIRRILSSCIFSSSIFDIFELKQSLKFMFKPELIRDEFCSFLSLETHWVL